MSFLKWIGKIIDSAIYAITHDAPAQDEYAFGSTPLEIKASRAKVAHIKRLVERGEFIAAFHTARQQQVSSDYDETNRLALMRAIADAALEPGASEDLTVFLADPQIEQFLTRDQLKRFAKVILTDPKPNYLLPRDRLERLANA